MTTKYPDFNYAEWVAEYKNALEKSLTTGVEILGLYVYAQNPEQKNQCLKKLQSVMNLLFTPDDEEEMDLTLDEAEIAVKS